MYSKCHKRENICVQFLDTNCFGLYNSQVKLILVEVVVRARAPLVSLWLRHCGCMFEFHGSQIFQTLKLLEGKEGSRCAPWPPRVVPNFHIYLIIFSSKYQNYTWWPWWLAVEVLEADFGQQLGFCLSCIGWVCLIIWAFRPLRVWSLFYYLGFQTSEYVRALSIWVFRVWFLLEWAQDYSQCCRSFGSWVRNLMPSFFALINLCNSFIYQ